MGHQDAPAENVAIFGITGALGRELQAALEVEQDAIGRFIPVAGTSSAGASVTWRGGSLPVATPGSVDPSTIDIAALACPASAARREGPRLLKAGVRVVDASGGLARTPLVAGLAEPAPLRWPRLANRAELADEMVVSLPGDVASTLAPVLEALTVAGRDGVALLPPVVSVDVVALRSAASAGRRGVHALSSQAVALLNYQPVLDPAPFPASLAFSVVTPSREDALLGEGLAADELRALVPALAAVPINVTPVLVSAFSGLVAVVTVRFRDPPSIARAESALLSHPDIEAAAAPAGDDDLGDDLDDEGAEAAPAGPTMTATTPADSDGVAGLRDALDSDAVRVTSPTLGPDGALRVVVMADPLHRTAVACGHIIAGWLAEASD
jgi:aspartate-semialdehyde dehydrogenase